MVALLALILSLQPVRAQFAPITCDDLLYVQNNFQSYILHEQVVSGRLVIESVGAAGLSLSVRHAGRRIAQITTELAANKEELRNLSGQIQLYKSEHAKAIKVSDQIASFRDAIDERALKIKELDSKISQAGRELEKLNNYVKNVPESEYKALRMAARIHETAPDKYRLMIQIQNAVGESKRIEQDIQYLKTRVVQQNAVLDMAINDREATARMIEDYDLQRGGARTSDPVGKAMERQKALSRNIQGGSKLTSRLNVGRMVAKFSAAALLVDVAAQGYESLVMSGIVDPPRFRAMHVFEESPGLLANPSSNYSFDEKCEIFKKSMTIQLYYREVSDFIKREKDMLSSGMYRLAKINNPSPLLNKPRRLTSTAASGPK